MRTRILSIGAFVLLSVFVFAVSPGAARETVRFKGYSAGTIVIKTNERRLYYVTGDGEAIRYPVGVGKAGQAGQIHQPGRVNSQRLRQIASDRSRWQPFKSYGCGRDDPEWGRPICHPWHQQSGIDRRVRLARMLSHVQSGHYGSVRTCQCGHDRCCLAVTRRDRHNYAWL